MKHPLENFIRDVPDFPKQGILFKDITTLWENPYAFKQAIEALYDPVQDLNIDKVVGIESRGFIFGSVLAERLSAGFVPARKPGKLPSQTIAEHYALEYGTDSLEIHQDAIKKGEKVLIHDDLLATGGTAKAACKLIEKSGGQIIMISFFLELTFLKGREKLANYNMNSIIKY
ncbi:adenine phosphoribosyltransferase [Catalinimonas alkaloidigena]|uniref:adenine phosphoribosyltransferase n=1 Tax=Catalinimonas alkaloidigena TaxID=1075417 RepID=UPI002404973E|nr:adenine phosphoribosyltransferase [Catalinimonas alkaloidigena]MDF9797012.1 adenine phosphoribosyltransferase [Catalinimonas alkaloidigena]